MKSRAELVAILATNAQAPGAWPNDTVVYKINSQPNDVTPDGARGVVIGSIDVRDQRKAASFAYFVKWDHTPNVPVAVVDVNNDGTPRLERRQ